MNHHIIQNDILSFLQKDTGRYHAVLCDPPYFLGSIAKRFGKPEAAAAITNGNDGSFARLSNGFMGQAWDAFESEWH